MLWGKPDPATLGRNMDFPSYRVNVLAVLARLQLLKGDFAGAEATVDQAKKDPNREIFPIYFLPIILADSELALKQGDYERTLVITDPLLAKLRRVGKRVHIPEALYIQGQAFRALGQAEEARERLLEARTVAEAMGSRRTLWFILFALSRLETDPTEAERLRQQAREIVAYIAGQTPADSRGSFFGLPTVRMIK